MKKFICKWIYVYKINIWYVWIDCCSEREREKSHSPRRTGNEEDQNILLGDELTFLGFPEDVEAMQVFEPTGKILS